LRADPRAHFLALDNKGTKMSDLRDHLRSAAVLVEHHGGNAEAEAARHAEKWRAKGNKHGYDLWNAIGNAIKAIREQTFQKPEN
jgi:hypothetical protein